MGGFLLHDFLIIGMGFLWLHYWLMYYVPYINL